MSEGASRSPFAYAVAPRAASGGRKAPCGIRTVVGFARFWHNGGMISSDLHIALSFLLTFGVPMLIAYRELRMVSPKRRRGGGDGNAPVTPPAPVNPDGDDALPPLPQSLIDAAKGTPAPQPSRPKVLEPV